MLIHICGIDGSGKTTLAKNLQRFYSSSHFLELSANTKLINQVNQICSKLESNRWDEFDNYFRSILWADELIGLTSICDVNNDMYFVDRYKLCNLIYSQLEDNTSLKVLKKIHKMIPDPDLIIFLDTPISIAQNRIKCRGGYSSPKEFPENMKLADKLYREYLSKYNKTVYCLDGSKSKRVVLDQAIRIINTFLKGAI